MKIKLSKGELDFRIQFGTVPDGRRSTTLSAVMTWNYNGATTPLKTTVLCSLKDQFSRKMGRKLVLQKFLHNPIQSSSFLDRHRYATYNDGRRHSIPLAGAFMGGIFFGLPLALTRADRELLWKTICPEFHRKSNKRTHTKFAGTTHPPTKQPTP